ncbi:MAG: SH3 domain-containing protein [Anaerolineae bacterium]
MKPLNRITILFAMLTMLLSLAFGGAVSASDAEQTFEQPILVVNTSFLNVRTGPGAQYTVLVTVVGGSELPVLGVFRDGVWYQVNTDGGPGWVNVEFTLPRGDFSNLPLLDVGETGAPNVNLGQGGGGTPATVAGQSIQGISLLGADLRAQPDYNALILSRNVPVDPNTIYPLINATTGVDGTIWYQVNVPNVGIGWMDRVEFRLLACGGENVGITQTETTIRFDGISAREPFILPANTEGIIGSFTGVGNQFVFFELVDGTVGFVDFSAISPRSGIESVCDGVSTIGSLGQGGGGAPASTEGTRTTVPVLAANTVIVNTGFLNLRSGPSASFSTVATVAGGTELEVLGRATDNVWFFVQGDFGQGWLNSQFTLFRGNYSTVPVISEPVVIGAVNPNANLGQGGGVAPVGAVGTGRSVTGVALLGKDMHEQPSYDSLIISRSVPNDPTTIYPLLATETDGNGTIWYLVDAPNIGRGWMDAVDFRILACGTDSVGILTQDATISFDSIANRDSFILPQQTEFYIVGRRNDQALIELVDGTVGLVNATAVAQRTGIESVCTGVTNTASTQTVGTMNPATTTTTTTTIPQVTGNRVVINTGNLNVRSGPNAGFSTVATVPGGTELAVIGRATDGVWYYIEGNFGRGWINSEFALFRGDYGTVPVVNTTGN